MVYKIKKGKTKGGGKNVTMYNLLTRNKTHSTGRNPFGLDMVKGAYLIPVVEGLNEQKTETGFAYKEKDNKGEEITLVTDNFPAARDESSKIVTFVTKQLRQFNLTIPNFINREFFFLYFVKYISI